jgi:serine protease Do
VIRTKTRTERSSGEKTARRSALCANGAVVAAAGLGMGVAVAGCGDDASTAARQPPAIVAVETQRCRQPNRFHGAGIVVGDDLVLTAGHTVEGELRALTVDGEPARVVAIDRRTDLAVISADAPTSSEVITAPDVPEEAQLILLDGTRDVAIDRHVTLVVEHATDQATYRRDVVIFTPGVTDGDSGSPIVDDAGRLVGIVVADQAGEGVAVTAAEIVALLATVNRSDDLSWPDPPGHC